MTPSASPDIPFSPVRTPPPRERSSFRSEEHTSELQSQSNLVCRLLLEKKKKILDAHVTDVDRGAIAVADVPLRTLRTRNLLVDRPTVLLRGDVRNTDRLFGPHCDLACV